MLHARAGRALLAAVAALALAACAAPVGSTATVTSEAADAGATAGTAAGPATAVLADRSIVPVEADASPALPVTVTSHERAGDRAVEVTDVSRIVAVDMSGAIAATVVGLGLGDGIVGRDTAASFPGLEDVPEVTAAGHTLTPEAVLALEPTVVVTDGSIGPSDAVAQVRDAGIPVVYVENEAGFAGAQELARQVGAALGVPDAGKALADRIADEVAEATAQVADLAATEPAPLRMAFLYLRGSAGVYYMFGDESGADELIEVLGGVDAAAGAGITGMQPLTDEAMLAANPDVILVMTKGLDSVGGIDGLVEARPAVALTTAGQERRIVDMADADILAFGPRSAAIVLALAEAVYGS